MNNSKPAVLVIGHGTRDENGVRQFLSVAEHFRERFPDRHCATGFLEFARPTIAEGLDQLLAAGATRVTAVPGMLMAAGHAKNDIPSEINELQAYHPGVEIAYGAELGVNAKLLRAARDRIEQAEAEIGTGYERKKSLLMVVGRGASDSDANSNISKVTRMLWEGMGFGWAETCYSGVTRPLVPEGLDQASKLGFGTVIVFPYFLFSGRLIDRIYAATDDFQAANPTLTVAKASYLNDHPLVLEALEDGMNAAERGDARMNCQLCQYREQIIGFEDRQGAPQVGHHHHVRGIGTDTDTGHSHHHDHHQEHPHAHRHTTETP